MMAIFRDDREMPSLSRFAFSNWMTVMMDFERSHMYGDKIAQLTSSRSWITLRTRRSVPRCVSSSRTVLTWNNWLESTGRSRRAIVNRVKSAPKFVEGEIFPNHGAEINLRVALELLFHLDLWCGIDIASYNLVRRTLMWPTYLLDHREIKFNIFQRFLHPSRLE